MRRGVVRSMTTEFWLTPLASGGTSVRFRLAVEPRWALLAPIAKLQLWRFAGRIVRELRQSRSRGKARPDRVLSHRPFGGR
jgi:hypothetical protein